MQYFGGKARIASKIAEYLNSVRTPGQTYWEPFVGGANVLCRITDTGPRRASDICEPLIAMYQALQNGWVPPNEVTEVDYQLAKMGVCDPATQAFIGFGCSFAGKWFGGFARGGHGADAKTALSSSSSPSLAKKPDRNYAANAASSLRKSGGGLRNVSFFGGSYEHAAPVENAVIYCDPPYAGTTGYGAAPPFISADFWRWAGIQSLFNRVYVSEYAAPEGWAAVLEIPTRLDIRNGEGKLEPRIEKLFLRRGCE